MNRPAPRSATPDITLIRQHISAFREAVKLCPRADLPRSFERFPNGCGSDATLLVGAFLEDAGFGLFDRYSGTRNAPAGAGPDSEPTVSHTWAQLGNIIVDITAEQFPDAPGELVLQAPSAFHQSFSGQCTGKATFRLYDEVTKYHFEHHLQSVLDYYTLH